MKIRIFVLIGLAVLFQESPLFGAPASGDRFMAIAMPGLPEGSRVNYGFGYEPGQGTDPRSGDPIMTSQDLRGFWTVARDQKQAWAVNQTVSVLNLSDSPQIPSKNWPVPESLWNLQTGATYKRLGEAGREWTVNLNAGSASDKPFNSLAETVVRLGGIYRLPSGEKNAWLFLLDYSNNRGFLNNLLLPGVLYSWQNQASTMQMVIGFPVFAWSWRPNSDWNLNASLVGPRRFSSEIGRRLVGPVRAYAGFERVQEEWLRANRDDNKNRLVYSYNKWSLGVKTPVWKSLSLDISGGREFNRSFFENRSSQKLDDNIDRADFPGTWYTTLKLSWRTGGKP